jgi:anti-anti-sigma regulatory factor
MPGCRIVRETDGMGIVIRIAGVFDRASAVELNERLEHEGAGEVVLDFSHVREFADLGVAALAHGLAGADRRIRLRGLRQHQVRIFRYFGVDLETVQARLEALPPPTR